MAATDHELLTAFGRRLRGELEGRGLRQTALSEACGAHVNAVGAWVRGKRWPRPENLLAIAEVLDVTVDWLLTGYDQDEPAEHASGADTGQARELARDLAELAPMLDGLAERVREATTAA